MICQQETSAFTQWLTDPDTILAIVIVIVSILSFRFTVWYSKKVLRVNIRPFLMVVPSISDNDFYGKLEIQNKGLGTAIIDGFSIKYGSSYFGDIYKLIEKIENNAKEEGFKSFEVKYKVFKIPEIFAIGKDEKINFFGACLGDEEDKDAVAYIIEEFFKLTVNIEYHDMDGKKFKDSFVIK
ncbi:MAG: hypothetical protein ACOCUL_01240 [Bacteroidota bacterium]